MQSAIRRLPVNCAAARFRERGVERKWTIDIFHEALNFGLQLLGAGHLQLKEKQCEVLQVLVIDNKDVLAVLQTGYGKSLIYQQLLAPTYNFMDFAGSPGCKKSTVIVISPLNALIRDQIVKMSEGGLEGIVWTWKMAAMTMTFRFMCLLKY